MNTVLTRDSAIRAGNKFYFTGIPCPKGHISQRRVSSKGCVECERCRAKDPSVKAKQAARHLKNRDENLRKMRERNEGNKEKRRLYLEARAGVISEQKKSWYEHNREAILADKKIKRASPEWKQKAKELRERKKPLYQCKAAMHHLIQAAKHLDGRVSDDYMGYPPELLRQRIEYQFKPGMSWENHGEWHIDHKKPISRFVDQGITDRRLINSLCNLQPLWASENLAKYTKF
ncbi:MAG: hypothetical protein E6199_01360 [Mixta calida]|nr:hypothetical protein [Pantoea sp.]MDU5189680.1 hypothetical protein [Mixta calida]